jgi:hypothetical protein
LASLVWRVQNLVVKYGEVQGKTKADWMGWCEVGLGNFCGVLIGLEGLVGGLLTLIANGKLSEITVIITLPGETASAAELQIKARRLHLVVEDLGLSTLGRWNQMRVKDIKDILTDLGKLCLDLLAILLDQSNLAGVSLGVLLLFN